MSGYTVGEIVVWLLLAAALGFALGWIARELLLRARSRPASDEDVRDPAPATEPAPAVESDAVEEEPAKKTPAKKTPAKKTPAKKSATKKTPARKTPAKKTAAKKAPAKKAAPPEGPGDT